MEDRVEVQMPRRRRHSAEFKAEAVSACMRPGISMAAVALHYRINANLLRRWVAAREAKYPVGNRWIVMPMGWGCGEEVATTDRLRIPRSFVADVRPDTDERARVLSESTRLLRGRR
jgi:hypothetical protein